MFVPRYLICVAYVNWIKNLNPETVSAAGGLEGCTPSKSRDPDHWLTFERNDPCLVIPGRSKKPSLYHKWSRSDPGLTVGLSACEWVRLGRKSPSINFSTLLRPSCGDI